MTTFKDDLYVNSNTGYLYSVKGQNSEPCAPVLPEQFRQFATMEAPYLAPYVKDIKYYFLATADVATILEHFPTWESVKNSDDWKRNDEWATKWDETKHNLFKECLEWCNEQGGFWGRWPW